MSGIYWIYILLSLYIIYCFYWGLKGYFSETTSSGYAIGGRSIPFIAFLLAVTAASFSGWTFIGHPGLIWEDGLPYAFASFYVLTIPITGAFFSKRTWLLGKRYGFITPGDMYAYYFNSEAVRWLVVLTAVLYSVFYTAVQFMAADALFSVIVDIPFKVGAIILAFIVWFYVCTGGMKASNWVGVIQFILMITGIIILGLYVLNYFGGWSHFSAQLAQLDDRMMKIPRVINFGIGGAEGESGWTAVMILTYLFALMGVQSSPAFTMWAFGIKSPSPLAWQQVFMSTFVVGFALFFFSTFQGLGAKILQNAAFSGDENLFRFIHMSTDKEVVPMLMEAFLPPFMLGIVFMGAIAAIHSTAAPYIGTGGSILLRDVYWRYIKKQEVSNAEQILVNRIMVTILTILALGVCMISKAALVILGALAGAFGFLMYLLLMGIIWGFRFPSRGVVLGIFSGMIAVVITYHEALLPNLFSMHCSFWGLFVGLSVACLCRGIGIKDDEETQKRQAEVRKWLDDIDAPSKSAKKWRRVLKFFVPLWFIFAVGPACILGNYDFFSFCGFPSLWSWQIIWWVAGIVMMWALCFKAEMSTTSDIQIERAEKEQMIVVKEV